MTPVAGDGRRHRLGAAVSVVALLCSLVVVSGCGATVDSRRTTLTYCAGSADAGVLELYEPVPAPTRAVPLVVWVHGGAWLFGDAAVDPGTPTGDVESAVVGRGWLFATLDYGLAPQHPWPAPIEDVACAVRYLRARAAPLHIDPAHIGAVGASAGGQLVSLLGLAPSSAGFDVGPFLDESSRPQAVVDEYGPADLNAPSWSTTPLATQVSPEVFGVPARPPSAALAAASPVTYVGPGAPPFLVVQGDEDDIVAPAQSRELVARLEAVGAPVTFLAVQGAGHGLTPKGAGPVTPSVDQVTARIVAFLEASLG